VHQSVKSKGQGHSISEEEEEEANQEQVSFSDLFARCNLTNLKLGSLKPHTKKIKGKKQVTMRGRMIN
jgi:hypothetical protein